MSTLTDKEIQDVCGKIDPLDFHDMDYIHETNYTKYDLAIARDIEQLVLAKADHRIAELEALLRIAGTRAEAAEANNKFLESMTDGQREVITDLENRLEGIVKIAERELSNTSMLSSNPPKSSAAWNILQALQSPAPVSETPSQPVQEHTARGFSLIKFNDRYDVPCSLQKSSLATEDAIWLGCTDANPRHLVPGSGWVPVEMPAEYVADTRMHLTVEQVEWLLPILQHFVKTGEVSSQPTLAAPPHSEQQEPEIDSYVSHPDKDRIGYRIVGVRIKEDAFRYMYEPLDWLKSRLQQPAPQQPSQVRDSVWIRYGEIGEIEVADGVFAEFRMSTPPEGHGWQLIGTAPAPQPKQSTGSEG